MEWKKITTENVQRNEYVIRMRNMQKGRTGEINTYAHSEIDYELVTAWIWFIPIDDLIIQMSINILIAKGNEN